MATLKSALPVCVIITLFLLIGGLDARKHKLKIEDDDREVIDLITFGFLKNGYLAVNLTGFIAKPTLTNKPGKPVFGFTLDKTVSTGIPPYYDSKTTQCILQEPMASDDGGSTLYLSFDLKAGKVNIKRIGKDYSNLTVAQVKNGGIMDFDENGSHENTDRLSDHVLLNSKLPTATSRRRRDLRLTRQKRQITDSQPDQKDDDLPHPNDTKDKNVSPTTIVPSASKPSSTLQSVAPSASPTTSAKPATPSVSAAPASKPATSSNSSVSAVRVTDSFPITNITNEDGTVSYSTHFLVFINNDAEEGLYNLYFHNCESETTSVNYTIQIIEKNGEENYLSAGEMPLPTLYFVACLVYFVAGCMFLWVLKRTEEPVFKIHYLMLSLMYVKALSLLFHAINYHYIKTEGHHEETFAILYYITYLMKGTLLFVTIVLIGAGWAFVKHILSDRDKKIFIIVIPLQILANVAQIIIEETEEGTTQYTTWKEIFILVDLLCCGAILFPVVWSIRHLQEASQTDGKAAINLVKLKIFRHFYILIVCYIYFTRIIVYLLKITVPFQYEWLDELFKELATLLFFIVTGYKFRPASNNPYLQVATSDDEEMDEVVTDIGALEGVKRVNTKNGDSADSGSSMKQRESSHEYD